MSHAHDAFMASKSKIAIRTGRLGEFFTFDGIKYLRYYRGETREAKPDEVLGYSDWNPIEETGSNKLEDSTHE